MFLRTADTSSIRDWVSIPDEDQVGIWVYDMKGEKPHRRIFERRG